MRQMVCCASLCLSLGLGTSLLGACSPAVVPITADAQIPAPANHPIQTQTLSFSVVSGLSGYELRQTALARYVRLVISGRDSSGQKQTIYALGADAQGYLETAGENLTLSAQVPDGSNWVVSVGFYSLQGAGGLILERKSAFHSLGRTAADAPVAVDIRTHLMGEIIAGLQSLESNLLNQPLDLNAYQAFVDGLTGAPTFSRLNTGNLSSPKDPTDIDSARLAAQIHNLEIGLNGVNLALGQSLNPEQYRRPPYVLNHFDLDPFTDGVRESLALDPSSATLFFHDTRTATAAGGQNQNLTDHLYGVTYQNGQFISRFKLPVGPVLSRYLLTGLANLDGQNPTPVVYLTRRLSTGLELVAYKQSDGSRVWGHAFPVLLDSDPGFTPVAWRDTAPNPAVPCGCDDVDVLYTAINSADASQTGVYKVRSNGTREGFYHYDGTGGSPFTASAVLKPDGTKLYLAASGNANGSGSELVVLQTANMQAIRVSLAPDLVATKMSPVRGRDGTLYLGVYNSQGSALRAFHADGTPKWRLSLANGTARPDYPPVVDIVNGKPKVYLHLNDGKVFAIQDQGVSGQLVWTQALGRELRGSALLAETLTEKYLYLGSKEMGQIIALSERDGSLIWKTSPDGAFASGFALREGQLFLTTKEGNDSSKVNLRAVKIEGQRLTTSAPWPRYGGNHGNSGVSLLPDN